MSRLLLTQLKKVQRGFVTAENDKFPVPTDEIKRAR